MKHSRAVKTGDWISSLREFSGLGQVPVEICGLCNGELGSEHTHLFERAVRRLHCACDACAILLCSGENPRFQRVPKKVTKLDGFFLSDAQWQALRIPIGLVFFVRSGAGDSVRAVYPGPAGATESTLDLPGWDLLAANNPVLGELATEVEALLINRTEGACDCYRLPIDRCYRLVGLIRKHWRGFAGGSEVWAAISAYFADLRTEALAGGGGNA